MRNFIFYEKVSVKVWGLSPKPEMSRTFFEFAITISTPDAVTDQEKLLGIVSDPDTFGDLDAGYLVRELGKNGDHPHFHGYLRYRDPKFSHNLKSTILRLIRPAITCELDDNMRKHMVDVKVAKDPEKWISQYLAKEFGANEIFRKNVDLEEVLQRFESRLPPLEFEKRRITPISLNRAPEAILEFAARTGSAITINRKSVLKTLHLMHNAGYLIAPLVFKVKDIHRAIMVLQGDFEGYHFVETGKFSDEQLMENERKLRETDPILETRL